jgi:D-glycero-alpha-D-manno-heptose 1-phosphate guanylyltransferase
VAALPSRARMKAVILAGGFATRLGDRAGGLPKAMVRVAGRPFIEYVLDRLVAGGIGEIVFALGFRADAVTGHFRSAYRGIPLRYFIEPRPLGTGGAIAYATRAEPDRPVLVLNGDTYLALDYRALLAWHASDPDRFAMVVRPVPDVSRYGAISIEGDTVTGFSEKGASGAACINAGTYILRPGIFSELAVSGAFSFEGDVLQRHVSTLRPRAFRFDGYFIDIGIPEDLDRAELEFRSLEP